MVNLFKCTSKLVYNNHPWDPEIVAFVERWSLFRGYLCKKKFQQGPQNSGRYRQVVAIRRRSLAQVVCCYVIFYLPCCGGMLQSFSRMMFVMILSRLFRYVALVNQRNTHTHTHTHTHTLTRSHTNIQIRQLV